MVTATAPIHRLTGPVADPLSAVAALAGQVDGPFVLYERDSAWSLASGVLAELTMDRAGVRLRTADGERVLPLGVEPLQTVASLLVELPMPHWRAHGWAAFELTHLLHGDPDAAGDATLLHLVVPEVEVRVDAGGASLSAPTAGRLDHLGAALAAPTPDWPVPGGEPDVATAGADAYRAAVADAVRDIRAERLQKVILSRVVPVPDEIDLVATYVAGRRGNTPARSFLLRLGGLQATGFSPETVLEITADGRVSTQPLAGTRALTGDPVTDLARRVELLCDPKEIFEHAISVRLAQDELTGVCRQGSVRVEEFMSVQERGSVQHLASRVSGTLAPGRNPWHAFAALFPAVTASGIPKAPAYRLIARAEGQPRGLYSGAVMTLDSDGALDAALVLRTVFVQDGRTWLRAGAGIVALSTPERELEETCEKLRSVSRFLVPVRSDAHPAGGTPVTDLTVEGLRRTAAELTDEDAESIGADTNLFELGLESIALMRLVSTWRRAGIEVNFAELAQTPTLAGWSTLLARRAPAALAGPAPAAEAASCAEDGEFPLAVLQHAYWIGRADGQRLGGVAAHLYVEFDGADVEPRRLRVALDLLVRRHGMLRVVITDNGNQRIADTSGWRGLTVHDLRELPDAERDRRLAHVRDEYSHQLLDIEAGEVFATALSLLPGGRTRLHVDVDMVAADAVSYRILLADLARLYADQDAGLPPLEFDFARYRAARPAARRDAAERAARWWRDRVPSLPPAPALPAARPRPTGAAATRVTRRALHLSPSERAALAEAARANGVTVAMAVATAFAELVGAWSGQSRFLLNVPLFDREPVHPDVAHVVGDFTSSVLLEVDLTEPATFAERAGAVQARLHADAAHADYTGVEVLRDLTRRCGEQVIAPVVFTSALGLGELFAAEVYDTFGQPTWIISQGPQVQLDAQVTEVGGGLLVNWDAREAEFPPGVVDAMFGAFSTLVRRLASPGSSASSASSGSSVSSELSVDAWRLPVSALVPDDQLARRVAVDDTGTTGPARRLHDGFFAHAASHPAAPAVLGDAVPGHGGSARAVTVSYGELADRALRAAAALVARGVAAGDPVGVTLPPGPDQVVAVLGVLAAGAVFVPVGVEQPPARAERITRLSGHRVTLVDTPRAPHELALAEALRCPPLTGPVEADPDALAYVLFTSGSTGEPKGVEVPHRAAMATIGDLVARFGLGAGDRTLALSAPDFDLSVFDVFAPLSVGGAVVTVPDRGDPHGWGPLVAGHGVTVINCVPALLDMLLGSAVPLGDTLRLVLLGGDRVGVDLPARLAAAAPGCRFVGLGGTTETAIHSTVCEVRGPVPVDWHCVPYGTPLAGVRLRVVDRHGRDCPDWAPGELWIGGDGVARGYRGDQERTAERFVTHDGVRWYRTGDLARYRDDGTVEFLGRRDHQVKLRGFRIELGEIEAALLADPAVRSAVPVLADGHLVAGVVLAGTATVAAVVEEVRERVRGLLPPHMVPEVVVALDAVPLTANGKVDRAAVAAAARAGGAAVTAPRTALERLIALVWREELGVADGALGVHEPFFALGGDSVLATAIVARLRAALDTAAVTVRSMLGTPTVAGLAAALASADERLEESAQLYLDVEALSDDEVDLRLAGSRP
jgi:mycobactin phenyloxazoline synthetase